jgi:hypothetical protein
LQTVAIQAVDTGSFDLRGPTGHQWTLAKQNPNIAERYKAVGKSYLAQRNFRIDWAKGEYDKLRVDRTKTTMQKSSFGSYGEQ